jgi:hypothetical protein
MMVAAYADVQYPSLRAVQTIIDRIGEEDSQAIKDRDPKSDVDESLVKEVVDSGLTKTLYGK